MRNVTVTYAITRRCPDHRALRARLEAEGRPMGGNDLLIAAQAISGGFTLVTDDRAFERVPRLATENWLR